MVKIINFARGRAAREQTFNALVRPHLQVLYRMAYRWTRSREDAEDLVQETLVRVIDRVGEMERLDKLRPWLIKILYHCFVDLYRKRSRTPLQNESDRNVDAPGLEDLVSQTGQENSGVKRLEQQRDLLRALDSLGEEQLDVILLHDVEDYSASEVASILEINIGTVKSRLHRTRQHRVDLHWRHHQDNGRWTLRYRLDYNDRDDLMTENTFLSYSPLRNSILLDIDWYASSALTLSVGGEYKNSRYAGENRMTDIDGIFKEQKRKSDRIDAWVKGQYELTPSWRILAEYRYSDNNDTFELYQYKRNEIKAAIEFTY